MWESFVQLSSLPVPVRQIYIYYNYNNKPFVSQNSMLLLLPNRFDCYCLRQDDNKETKTNETIPIPRRKREIQEERRRPSLDIKLSKNSYIHIRCMTNTKEEREKKTKCQRGRGRRTLLCFFQFKLWLNILSEGRSLREEEVEEARNNKRVETAQLLLRFQPVFLFFRLLKNIKHNNAYAIAKYIQEKVYALKSR